MLIQTPRLARKLQRALRLTALPDSVLAPETVPVILVEDLSAPLSDEDRGCIGAGRQGAVAGENSILSLVRVGAPAPYDLVVNQIFVSTPTTGLITIRKNTAAVVGLTALNTTFMDFQTPGRPSSQFARDSQVGIPAGIQLYQFRILADELKILEVNIRVGTIGDGNDNTTITMAHEANNADLVGGYQWTESAPQG